MASWAFRKNSLDFIKSFHSIYLVSAHSNPNYLNLSLSGITQFHLPNKIIPSLDYLRHTFSYKLIVFLFC